ncbi:unnamed protein product [Diatraea saccharalis]|uniref:Uncharacterized protein n=1 Tax=Diatraea saccharalis TaxID=40085 RepID=A0A9N9RA98_9NEOP|nr:unnamed protein product [Diatraea saccharalis]
MFYKSELDKDFIRDDYRELVEPCVVFLGGDMEKKLKLRPPGAMHQARWMAKAIYSLKICLLQSQLKMTAQDKKALQDVCLFIVTLYVKPWLKCTVATKAPNQDLCFLKMLKEYEKVDATISKASISKFSHHLWYLSEEAVILSLFDDDVCNQTKIKMIANLNRNKSSDFGKRYETSKEELTQKLFDKTLDDFVSEKSKQFFSRLQINDSFLGEDVVNDTAERAVKLMQDFNGLITAEEEQKQFLLRCVQEHRNLYPDCKKSTLKTSYPG